MDFQIFILDRPWSGVAEKDLPLLLGKDLMLGTAETEAYAGYFLLLAMDTF